MRAIDGDAMLARLEEWNTSDSTDKALYNFTLHRILEQPTIEPERKKGKWVQDNIASNVFRCSECGCDAPVDPTAGCEIKSNFCQWCGTDMRGKQNE